MTTRCTSVLGPALVALVALVSGACSSAGSQVTSGPAPSLPGAISNGEHGFGSSVEEWAEQRREAGSGSGTPAASSDVASSGFTTIAWSDLVPPGQTAAEIGTRYHEELAQTISPTEAEEIYGRMMDEMYTYEPNLEIDGQQIRLAGFVAPLTYDDDVVTEFLLVPTFGACIHVPPPPPNQTVMVTVDRDNGLTIEQTQGAVWVEGTIKLESASTDLAETMYTITQGASGVYAAF